MGSYTIDDAETQRQALAIIEAGDLAKFRPTAICYRHDAKILPTLAFPPERLHILLIAEIEPPLRNGGVAIFPRANRILDAIRQDIAMPPIYVEILPDQLGPYRYRTKDGFHRLHLSRALGFSRVPAIVWLPDE